MNFWHFSRVLAVAASILLCSFSIDVLGSDAQRLKVSVHLACVEGEPGIELAIENLSDQRIEMPGRYAPWRYDGRGVKLTIGRQSPDGTLNPKPIAVKAEPKIFIEPHSTRGKIVKLSDVFGQMGELLNGQSAFIHWEYSYPAGCGVPTAERDLGGFLITEDLLESMCH